MPRHLTFANVTSVLALTVALGGGGAAVAAGIAKDSVGTRQIIDGAVKNSDLGEGAVTGRTVRDSSLSGADINDSTLDPQGRVYTAGDNLLTVQTLSSDSYQSVKSLSMVAPRSGTLIITASGTFNASADSNYVAGYVTVDDTFVDTGFYWDAGDADGYFDQEQVDTSVTSVSKGNHTIDFLLQDATSGAPSEAVAVTLTVEFVPTNGPTMVPAPNRTGQRPVGPGQPRR